MYLDKEEAIKFWKSSVSESGSTSFLDDSSTLQDKCVFTQFGYFSKKN